MIDLNSQSDFEAGWIAAEMGQPLRSLQTLTNPKGASIAWRNGWRAFWESVGVQQS